MVDKYTVNNSNAFKNGEPIRMSYLVDECNKLTKEKQKLLLKISELEAKLKEQSLK